MSGPAGAEHPHRMPLAGLGVAGVLAGGLILTGGVLWGVLWTGLPSLPFGWPITPSAGGMAPWVFWTGIAFGAIVTVLGTGLILFPEHHGALGAGLIISSGVSFLAGPLLWGFILGLVAGTIAIVVGSPSSPRLYYYTPMHVSMPGPIMMPAAATPAVTPPTVSTHVPAGRFCSGCGRSVSSESEFCPWCGASRAPRTP
jgi:hypothetical protein